MIDESTLGEGVLQLLASSTSRSYFREATHLAKRSGLVHTLQSDADQREQARQRLSILSNALDGVTRTVEEVEMAIVLSGLAGADPQGSRILLNVAAACSSPWIQGLAARLLALAPPTEADILQVEAQLTPFLDGQVLVTEPLNSQDQQNPAAFPRAA